jgi:CheY-like chemotaxis protein
MATPTSASHDDADAPRIKVLVVDDTELNRRVMQVLLIEAGCSVTLSGTGDEAVDCARTQTFDLIVMDLHMPGLSGDEATRAIRAAGGSRSAMIAQWTTDDGGRRDAGLYDTRLPKPIRYPALLGLVGEARRRAAGRELAQPGARAVSELGLRG